MIPKGWKKSKISKVAVINVGRDLKEDAFSENKTDTHIYPVYSNTVENRGLYGYYNFQEYDGNSLTVVGRGAGLGTAFARNSGFGAIGRLLVISPNEDFDVRYFAEYVNYRLRLFHESGGIPQLPGDAFGKYEIVLPPVVEQKAIAEVLSVWDRAIEKTERLIQAKQKRFTGLVSKLICTPEFKRGHVREFLAEVSVRNKGQKIARVLSVTNHSGFVLPENQFERSVASSDLSNYKVVTSGQYAYNPSRINVGSIARLDGWDEGVLSPMYFVFSIDDAMVDSDFFQHWLSSNEAKQRIRKSAQGSVRESVGFADLGAIPFPMPEMSEQKRIAETLNLAQREIDLLKKLAEKQKLQKRGLMQKLLTGEWRVKVEEPS